MNERRKATIYDIAEATGFSVGTVNRALNDKPRIKAETKKLIMDTAAALGYKANPAAQGLRRAQIKIGVVMYCPVLEYVSSIARGIANAASDLEKFNVEIDVYQLEYSTNEICRAETVELLKRFRDEKYSGVALFSSSTNQEIEDIRQTVDELTESGIPVATIANDIPQSTRALYVGIDAFTAGRMAAEMLWLTCPHCHVALLTNSIDSEVNRGYVAGFHDFAGFECFSGISMYEHLDEPELVLRETKRMINENPELKGIYMTSASANIACEYIRANESKSYRIITTDLLRDTPMFLKNGTASATIFQDPYRQGRNAVQYLYHYILDRSDGGVHHIVPSILLSSNVAAYEF